MYNVYTSCTAYSIKLNSALKYAFLNYYAQSDRLLLL